MKVLLVSGSLPPLPCGVGDYTAALARELSKAGIETVVLTSRGAATNTPYQVMPAVKDWGMRELPAVLGLIRAVKPTVVHFQFPTQGYGGSYMPWLLPSLLKLQGWRVVQTWHEYYPRQGRRALVNVVPFDALVAVRPAYEESLAGWRWKLIRYRKFRFIANASVIPAVRLTESERLQVRSHFGCGEKALVAFFGFSAPLKGIDQLFTICDPVVHHLLLVGTLTDTDLYHVKILQLAKSKPWAGSVTITGHLKEQEVAMALAAADAVVLPFVNGGGMWNTTLKAALAQGVFVVTTSSEESGYAPDLNLYFAKPGDVSEMRAALSEYCGRRLGTPRAEFSDWSVIARSHLDLYQAVLGR